MRMQEMMDPYAFVCWKNGMTAGWEYIMCGSHLAMRTGRGIGMLPLHT